MTCTELSASLLPSLACPRWRSWHGRRPRPCLTTRRRRSRRSRARQGCPRRLGLPRPCSRSFTWRVLTPSKFGCRCVPLGGRGGTLRWFMGHLCWVVGRLLASAALGAVGGSGGTRSRLCDPSSGHYYVVRRAFGGGAARGRHTRAGRSWWGVWSRELRRDAQLHPAHAPAPAPAPAPTPNPAPAPAPAPAPLQLEMAAEPALRRVKKLLRKVGEEPRLLDPETEEALDGGWPGPASIFKKVFP